MFNVELKYVEHLDINLCVFLDISDLLYMSAHLHLCAYTSRAISGSLYLRLRLSISAV